MLLCDTYMMLLYRFAFMRHCYDVHLRSFRHVRLLWCSLPAIPSCEIVMVFSSVHSVMWDCYDILFVHSVMWDCYDILFRSFRHVRLLWCSLPVIPSCETVIMFTSGHLVTWDCYDVLFRSLPWLSRLNFLQSLRCKIYRTLQHTSSAVYSVG